MRQETLRILVVSASPETALQAGAGRHFAISPQRVSPLLQGWRTFSRRPFHRHQVKTRLSAAFARQRQPPRELADVKTEVRP